MLWLAAGTPQPVAAALRRRDAGSRLGRRVRALGELAGASSEGAAYRETVSVWRSSELDRLMPGHQSMRRGARSQSAAARPSG